MGITDRTFYSGTGPRTLCNLIFIDKNIAVSGFSIRVCHRSAHDYEPVLESWYNANGFGIYLVSPTPLMLLVSV